MRVITEVADATVDNLIRYAIVHGFKRDNPRKNWSMSENAKAVRFALEHWAHSLDTNRDETT